MGKIKIRTIGTELEEEQKKDQKKKREEKKAVHVPGMKGGERVVAVGPTEEELAKVEEAKEEVSAESLKKKKTVKKTKKRERSKRYEAAVASLDRNKLYDLPQALEILEKSKRNYDETVELHVNTLTPGISVTTTLPHGTHKKTRVAVATDSLIEEIEKGKIAFDVLLADPSMMGRLAKVAKVLGPRGLMPNSKAGTVTSDPEGAAKKFEGGQLRIKTEAKGPIMHISVGKMSFGSKKLEDNINAVIDAVKTENIKKAVLKSTQSPAIKLSI